jgi:hypothetical protein
MNRLFHFQCFHLTLNLGLMPTKHAEYTKMRFGKKVVAFFLPLFSFVCFVGQNLS